MHEPEDNLYSKYLKEADGVDPENENQDTRTIYRMNLSAKRVRASSIYGDGAELMEKLISEFDQEFD